MKRVRAMEEEIFGNVVVQGEDDDNKKKQQQSNNSNVQKCSGKTRKFLERRNMKE
jgi:hypothetical protein